MRRIATWLTLALMAGGCSFDTSGAALQGSAPPPGKDGGGKDGGGPGTDKRVKPEDIGPRPDKGGGKKDQKLPADSGGKPDKGPCGGKTHKCKDTVQSQICKNGAWAPYRKCPMGCNIAKGKCNNFNALNGGGAHLNTVSGKFVVNGLIMLDTTTGKFTPDQTGAKVTLVKSGGVMVMAVGQLEITPAGTLRVMGDLPLLVVASDKIVINGLLDVSADGIVPGPGGAKGGGKGGDGGGCGGGIKGKKDHFGGAGGSYGGQGGSGSSKGKAPCGKPCPTPLTGGSGGGDGEGNLGFGGAGGGALQLTAWTSITISGKVNAGGGGGHKGGSPDIFGEHTGAGGGGGSGGAVIMEAPQVTVDGVVAANGGGGAGAGSVLAGPGGKGGDGQATLSAASGGKGAVPIVSGDGGKGSSQLTIDGGGGDSGLSGLYFSGGGGGAAGRICVRTKTGNFGGKGATSPSTGGKAGAQETLKTVAP